MKKRKKIQTMDKIKARVKTDKKVNSTKTNTSKKVQGLIAVMEIGKIDKKKYK